MLGKSQEGGKWNVREEGEDGNVQDREAEYQESLKHGKRGGCIAVILLLIFVPLICYAIVTFTASGKGVWANGKP